MVEWGGTMNYLKKLMTNEEFEYWQGAENTHIANIENQLNLKLPTAYKTFLLQCGMCNYGDVNILGVAKSESKCTYPVVEMTKQLREELGIADDFLVLSYEPDEYITLYKTSTTEELNDSAVYGASVYYDDDSDELEIDEIELIFSSFDEYFADFLTLAEDE